MEVTVSGPGDYLREFTGSSFRVKLEFHELTLWLAGEEKPRVIKTSELRGVKTLPDGSTKLDLQFKKDVIIPSLAAESLWLADAVNVLLAERRATELRDKEAAQELKRRLQPKYAKVGSGR